MIKYGMWDDTSKTEIVEMHALSDIMPLLARNYDVGMFKTLTVAKKGFGQTG